MKNLKGMYIQNFQSHKDTKVDFAPTITTFVGESDKGKTSIFRALKLIVKNQPKGVSYITTGETKTTVGVILEDDSEVVRERTKSVNRYIVHNPDGTSLQQEGFGLDVPPDVLEVLDYQPVKIDTDLSIDLNFSEQLDGPFLLSESNASKARTIDGLAKINVFNIALRNTNKSITSFNNEARNIQKQLDEIEVQLKDYEDLSQVEMVLNQLQQVIEQMEALEETRGHYEQLLNQYNEVNQNIDYTIHSINELKNVQEVDQYIQQMTFQVQRKQMFSSLLSSYERVERDIIETENILSHKDSILTMDSISNELSKLHSKKQTYTTLHSQYETISSNIEKGKKFVARLSQVKEAGDLLDSLLHLSNRKQQLIGLFQQFNSTDAEISHYTNAVQQLGSIREVDGMISLMQKLVHKKNQLSQLLISLNECNNSIQSGITYKENMIQKINLCKQQYADLLKQFKKCPVCFGELDDNHLHSVVENM